jgi:hypothetical protein
MVGRSKCPYQAGLQAILENIKNMHIETTLNSKQGGQQPDWTGSSHYDVGRGQHTPAANVGDVLPRFGHYGCRFEKNT